MKKFALIALCAFAVFTMIAASPAPAASPAAAPAAAAAPASLPLLFDFEGKTDTNSWKGGSSSIAVAIAADQFHGGAKSLKVDAVQKDYCGLAIVLPADKTDWTGYSGLSLWTFGTGSNTSYNFYLEEAQGEQFLLGTVKDDVAGWKQVSFKFADAKSRTDYQAATAAVDRALQLQFLTVQIAPNAGTMSFFVDDISLVK